MAVADGTVRLGDLLRHWRRVRGQSQLDLASAARTTPRYVSFVETGRAQPSRQMIVRLAVALEVPLRERNGLLLAAGYAPLYRTRDLGEPDLARVEHALASMLAQHEPFPAVVMDRGWTVLRANGGAQRLFGGLLAPAAPPPEPNILELMLEPGPVRAAIANWEIVAPTLVERVHREAVGGVVDAATAQQLERLRALPELAALLDEPPASPGGPVFDVAFVLAGEQLRFFSLVSTIGTPADVTAQELRVEAFYPSDDATRDAWVGPQAPDGARDLRARPAAGVVGSPAPGGA